ncbi:MAG: DUF4202 domain-containing protein [Actinomycetes bacterium]
MSERFSRLYGPSCDLIDAANAQDPETLIYRGESHPKELLHAEMMTRWVLLLDPQADEAQMLAARAHHYRRWLSPRSDYPSGRSGYLRWRTQAKKRQAAEVAELLGTCGYSDAMVERVASLIRKEHLSTDSAVQTHEDALCLVFLDTQLDDVALKMGEEEIVAVIAKTLPKMSARGVQAVALLDLSAQGAGIVSQAVALHAKSFESEGDL